MESIYTNDQLGNVGEKERGLSLVGGVGLLAAALISGKKGMLPLAALGGYLVYRGVTGNCVAYRLLNINRAEGGSAGVAVERTVTINQPIAMVYQYWRNFENLPRFMPYLEEVQVLDHRRSHWVAKAPAGQSVEWDAEIVNEAENELIAWRSLPDAQVHNEGVVRFRPGPAGRGTEVQVRMVYNPPGGSMGAALAKILGQEPDLQVRESLRRFKNILETGEVPTTRGQPSGRGRDL